MHHASLAVTPAAESSAPPAEAGRRPSAGRQWALVALRTLVGWHLLYEGYYKLVLPAWSASGDPLGPWTSAGYLSAATGPLAPFFRGLAASGWVPWIDAAVVWGLILSGLSLMLGLFTQLGTLVAMALLALFYVAMIPLTGVPQPAAEGAYLIVNKTLVELAALAVLYVFRTGRLAGLDVLRDRRTPTGR